MSDMGRRSATQTEQQNAGGVDEFKTLPVSLADLQDDDDKSSLESGQVSPEAFNEQDDLPLSSNHHRLNPISQGKRGDLEAGGDIKRINKRRGRFSRSRSQSPLAGFNNNQGGFNQNSNHF